MITAKPKRFYKETSVLSTDEGYAVALDGRTVKTPLRRPLVVPVARLAEACRAEWAAQGETIEPYTMPLTQLATTWCDKIAEDRSVIVEQLLRFAETDLLYYRATEPQELVLLEQAARQPLLDWAEAHYGVPFIVTAGVIPVEQSGETLRRLTDALNALDSLVFTAVQSATPALGSVILALALAEQRLSAEEAYAISQLDETYQAELWGEDEEASDRRANLKAEVLTVGAFLATLLPEPRKRG